MEYIPLGRSSAAIPKIGVGTWQYAAGTSVIQRAVNLGAGFVDTAESYGTESVVGDEIRGIREQVFLATKVSAMNLAYDDVLVHAEASLECLGTDVLDLYQIHFPNPDIPITETMRAMRELVQDGRVKHVGVSNFSADDMRGAQDALGNVPLVSNQVCYNLFSREIELDVLPYCQEHEITVIAHTPLAKGGFRGHAGLTAIAEETGRTEAQVLLNWVISHSGVMAIPKTNRRQRVDEAVGSVGWTLNPEQVRSLEAAV